MIEFRNTLLAVSVVLISACGGGGGDSTTVKEEEEVTEIASPDQLTEIEMLRTYTGATNSYGYSKLTMPADGPVFFQRVGTYVRLYDQGLNLVAERVGSTAPSDTIDLNAGEYVVEVEFFSRRVKMITAYSPRLLSFNSLEPLANGTYKSTVNKIEFMKFTPTMDTTLNATGLGVRVAVFTPEMEKVVANLEQKSAVDLLAGNYVVELNYYSINDKEITIQSPALWNVARPKSSKYYDIVQGHEYVTFGNPVIPWQFRRGVAGLTPRTEITYWSCVRSALVHQLTFVANRSQSRFMDVRVSSSGTFTAGDSAITKWSFLDDPWKL